MNYDSGESCPTGGLYSMKIDIKCNEQIPADAATFQLMLDSTECAIHLSGQADVACPRFNLSWLIDQYFFVYTLVFLIGGVAMNFYGLKLFAAVLFLFGALAVGTLILIIIYALILPINSPKWAFLVTLIVSYVLGAFAGMYIVRYQRYCFFLVGIYLGAVLSIFLFNLILYKIIPDKYLFHFMICSAIGFAIINYFYKTTITILSTSITGSYMTVRGISFILGGFPSEMLIYDLIKRQEFEKIPWSLDIYLSLILFMAVIGVCMQYREKTENEKDIFIYSHPYQLMHDALG